MFNVFEGIVYALVGLYVIAAAGTVGCGIAAVWFWATDAEWLELTKVAAAFGATTLLSRLGLAIVNWEMK